MSCPANRFHLCQNFLWFHFGELQTFLQSQSLDQMLTVGSAAVKIEHSVVATPNILHGIFIWRQKGLLVASLLGYYWDALVLKTAHAQCRWRLEFLFGEPEKEANCTYGHFKKSFFFLQQLLFIPQWLTHVPQTYGSPDKRAHCCSPWTELESLTATADQMDNKQTIVTISHSRQKNINDMRYKQLPLISERPHDFKQPDSLWGPGVQAREIWWNNNSIYTRIKHIRSPQT